MESFEDLTCKSVHWLQSAEPVITRLFCFYGKRKANPAILRSSQGNYYKEPLSLRLLASVFRGLKPWALSLDPRPCTLYT